MRRSLVLAFGLLLVPSIVAAQVEIGVDGGLSIESIDDADENITAFSIPNTEVRVGFWAGEALIIETRFGLDWTSVGDFSFTGLGFVPGVNFLFGERFYARGEAGFVYLAEDDGADDESATQLLLGAAAGMRVPVVDNIVFRLEGGLDRWLENEDEFIPASWEFRIVAGLSAMVN